MKTQSFPVYIMNGDENSQKLIVQANIPYTIIRERSMFTHMVEPDTEPENVSNEAKNAYYQRRIDFKRVRKIADFIRTTILQQKAGKSLAVLFPTAMLLATRIEETEFKVGEKGELEFADNDEKMYIIDGQHRLSGMNYLYDSLDDTHSLFPLDDDSQYIKDFLDNYTFNCTILLNFDMWEQAQVFADVNFNQKKVEKSLYYSIYGMVYPETDSDLRKNYIYIAHRLVRMLHTNPSSPLQGLIKMLGYSKGLISQSFLADSLIRNIQLPRGIWHDAVQQPQPRLRPIAVECVSFFEAVSDVFSEAWPQNHTHRSIILKTTGVGALVRLMEYIHKYHLSDRTLDGIRLETEEYLNQEYYHLIERMFRCIKAENSQLFSFNGEFSQTGGAGLERKLYKRMEEIVSRNFHGEEQLHQCNKCGEYFSKSQLNDSGLCPKCEDQYAYGTDDI